MRISKKEIIKAIYIKLASDTLEFITISSKQELQAKTDAVKAAHPNNPVVVKTFMSIEDPTDRFYKFKCEVIGQDFIAELIPNIVFILAVRLSLSLSIIVNVFL